MSDAPLKIRCSSLTNYPDCGRRVAADIFRDEVEAAGFKLRRPAKSIGAIVGTAVHKGAALLLVDKLAGHALVPHDSGLVQEMLETLDHGVREGVHWDEATPNRNDAQKQAVRMLGTYGVDIYPHVKPILVEERLEAEVTPTLILSGQADTIAREPGKIRDLKTGKAIGNHRPQVGGYSLISRSNGYDIEAAGVDYIPRASLKKPQPPAVTIDYDVPAAEAAAATIVRAMDTDLKTFREGDFRRRILPGDPWAFMANPNSRLCHSNWCSAWGTEFCKEHSQNG